MRSTKIEIARRAAYDFVTRSGMTAEQYGYASLNAYVDGIARDLVTNAGGRNEWVNGMRFVSTPWLDYVEMKGRSCSQLTRPGVLMSSRTKPVNFGRMTD